MTQPPALTSLMESLETEAAMDRDPAETPNVGIVMGSDSDLPVMRDAYDAFTELGFEEHTGEVPSSEFSFETFVISAHRTPELLEVYAKTATDRGLEVIIAAAGGKAAHLPGVTAGLAYPLPVIGVPIQEKSISAVIGMPSGVPILTVDAGDAYNAALAAVQTLSHAHPELQDRLRDRQTTMKEDVARVCQSLHSTGTPDYLADQ